MSGNISTDGIIDNKVSDYIDDKQASANGNGQIFSDDDANITAVVDNHIPHVQNIISMTGSQNASVYNYVEMSTNETLSQHDVMAGNKDSRNDAICGETGSIEKTKDIAFNVLSIKDNAFNALSIKDNAFNALPIKDNALSVQAALNTIQPIIDTANSNHLTNIDTITAAIMARDNNLISQRHVNDVDTNNSDVNVCDMKVGDTLLLHSNPSVGDVEMDDTEKYRENYSTDELSGKQSESLEKTNTITVTLANEVSVDLSLNEAVIDNSHMSYSDTRVGNKQGDGNLLAYSEASIGDVEEDEVDGIVRKIACAFKKYKPFDEDDEPYVVSNCKHSSAAGDKVHVNNNKLQNVLHLEEISAEHGSNFTKHSVTNMRQDDKTELTPRYPKMHESTVSSKSTTNQVKISLTKETSESCATTSYSHGLVEGTTKSNVSTIKTEDTGSYNFSHEQRGYMIIVVNEFFSKQRPRNGADKDLQKLKSIAEKLGFQILNKDNEKNLDKSQLMEILNKAQALDHSKCDSFAFAISTHGLETQNANIKGMLSHALVCADDQLIFTSTIFQMFNDENCPVLKNKPKLFFIQACRGENLDPGCHVSVVNKESYIQQPLIQQDKTECTDDRVMDEYDVKYGQDSWAVTATEPTNNYGGFGSFPERQKNISNTSETSQNLKITQMVTSQAPPHSSTTNFTHLEGTPSLTCENDMVVLYAIPPGMFAWRNANDGSWMIDFLHKVLKEYDMQKPKNFITLLTKVSAMMSKKLTCSLNNPKLHEQTAVSVVEHKIFKDIIFSQKSPLSK